MVLVVSDSRVNRHRVIICHGMRIAPANMNSTGRQSPKASELPLLRDPNNNSADEQEYLQAPMLYCGERIGSASEPLVDIAVDPLDGTTLVSQGRNGAVAVIAVAERGALFDPGPCMYMEKLAVGAPRCQPTSLGEPIRPVSQPMMCVVFRMGGGGGVISRRLTSFTLSCFDVFGSRVPVARTCVTDWPLK